MEPVLSLRKLRRNRVLVTLPSGEYIVSPLEVPPGTVSADPESLLEAQSRCARSDAGGFLEYRERTTGQLRNKMISLGYPAETADDVVQWAENYSYVDDRRFCKIYMASKTMGKLRFRVELLKRGVSAAAVEEVLSAVSDSMGRENAVAAVRKKYGAMEDREKAYRRAAAWLQRRGYSSGFIAGVLREAL